MRIRAWLLVTVIVLVSVLVMLMMGSCQPAPNTTGNVNNSTTNTNTNTAPPPSAAETSIDTREPQQYSATLVFTLETESGDKTIGIPPLSLKVARNGADRRVEFNLPDHTPLIYIDHDNHHYVVAPSRQQYAELTQEATGVQLQKLMTPGQLAESLKDLKGVHLLGEETWNGRAAQKYGYSGSTNTNTSAGQVSTQAYAYIDKETGLPLRAELASQSSGDVKGVKGARIAAEMHDIKTAVDNSLFTLPQGYAQVPPEKIREQIDALTAAVGTILKTMMGKVEAPPATPSPSASGSPRT